MAARALAIDDDPSILAILEEILCDLGWSVDGAATPDEARAVLSAAEEPYDLVLSDAFRLSCTDYGWLEQLRQATAAPIVIISGWPPATFSDYRERGYAGFLAKPFDLDDLTTLVASFGPQHAL